MLQRKYETFCKASEYAFRWRYSEIAASTLFSIIESFSTAFYPTRSLDSVSSCLWVDEDWENCMDQITCAAFGVGFRHTRNPFLALSMVTHKAIDPQFCAIFQSIQTCRNVGRFIPNHLDVMSLCLGAENGKYWSGLCFVTDRVKLVGFTLVTSRGNGKIVVFISFLRLWSISINCCWSLALLGGHLKQISKKMITHP